ncbi:MAG: D-2-hydroxyacid dehydrogenase family protein [Alphaproteobacteria bacterium]|nr:D-2-hydroxyacid dehydrogenase family protein [Alphaproteobacteria bacterium]
MRVAILDDYQNAALTAADWPSLAGVEATPFTRHIADAGALIEALAGFSAVIAMRERTPFPAAVLGSLPDLRLLVTAGMRNAAIDMAAASARGITVCGTDMLPYPTAELTWGLILAACRNIVGEAGAMRSGGWQTTLGLGLKGKVLGVLGLGRLGEQVAAVGKAFGMEVLAWSQNLTAERAAACGARLVAKERLLATSDILTIHLVLSPRTRGLIGADELRRMKPSALIVNTSRGPILDEAALVAALEGGWIAGAALDVYDTEPLPPDHPLRRLPNALLTPHLGYVTAEGYRLVYGQAIENIRAFRSGAPIRVLNAPVGRL